MRYKNNDLKKGAKFALFVSSYLPLKKYSATTTSAFALSFMNCLRHCLISSLLPNSSSENV